MQKNTLKLNVLLTYRSSPGAGVPSEPLPVHMCCASGEPRSPVVVKINRYNKIIYYFLWNKNI